MRVVARGQIGRQPATGDRHESQIRQVLVTEPDLLQELVGIGDASARIGTSRSSKCITGTRLMRPPERPSPWANRQRGAEDLTSTPTRRADASASPAKRKEA